MRKWLLLLGGLLIWAAHFFLVYAFSIIFPGSPLANTLTLIATVPALAADAGLLWIAAAGTLARRGDAFDGWVLRVAAVGAGLSFVAILWMTLPAVMI